MIHKARSKFTELDLWVHRCLSWQSWNQMLAWTTNPPLHVNPPLNLGFEGNRPSSDPLTAFFSSLLQALAPSSGYSGYHSNGIFQAALLITFWKQKWMIDGEMRLVGSRVCVWGEGAEWYTESRRCIFLPFPLSATLCSPAAMAAQLALATSQQYQPTIYSAPDLYFGSISPHAHTFYKAKGGIMGCVKMSKNICHSENMQTRCDSRIINQQLLIFGT